MKQLKYKNALRFFTTYLEAYGQGSLFRRDVFGSPRFQMNHEFEKASGIGRLGWIMALMAAGIGLMGGVLLTVFLSHLPQVLSLAALIARPSTLSWLVGIATGVGMGSVFLLVLPYAFGGGVRYGLPKRYFALMTLTTLWLGFILSCGVTMGTFHTLSISLLMAQTPVFWAVNVAVLCSSLILVAWNTWGLHTKPGFETVGPITMAASMLFMTVLAEAGLAAWMMHWLKAPSLFATLVHPGFMVPGLLMLAVSLVAIGVYTYANWHKQPSTLGKMMAERQSLIQYGQNLGRDTRREMRQKSSVFAKKVLDDHQQRRNMVAIYKVLIIHASTGRFSPHDILTKMGGLFGKSNVYLWLGSDDNKTMRDRVDSDISGARKALSVLKGYAKFQKKYNRSIWLRHPLPFSGLVLSMSLAVMLMMFDALPIMAPLLVKTGFMVSTMVAAFGFGLVWTALVFAFSGIQAIRLNHVNTMLRQYGMGTITQPLAHLQSLTTDLHVQDKLLNEDAHAHFSRLGHPLAKTPMDLSTSLSTLKFGTEHARVETYISDVDSKDRMPKSVCLPQREEKALHALLEQMAAGQHRHVQPILSSKKLHEDMPIQTFFSSHFDAFFHYGVVYFAHPKYAHPNRNVCLEMLQLLEAADPKRFAQLMAQTKLEVTPPSWGRNRITTGVSYDNEVTSLGSNQYAPKKLPPLQVEAMLNMGGHSLLLSLGAYKKMTPKYQEHMNVQAQLSPKDHQKVQKAWQGLKEAKSDFTRIKLLRYRTTFFKYALHHALMDVNQGSLKNLNQIKAMSLDILSQLKYDQHFWAQNFDALLERVRPTLRSFSKDLVDQAQRSFYKLKFDRIWQRQRISKLAAHLHIIKQLVKHDWQRMQAALKLSSEDPLATSLSQAFLAPKQKPVKKISRRQPIHKQVTNAVMGEDRSRTTEASQVLFYGFMALAGLMAATVLWLTTSDRILLSAAEPHTMLFLMQNFTFQCVAIGLLLAMATVAVVMIVYAWAPHKGDVASYQQVDTSCKLTRQSALEIGDPREYDIKPNRYVDSSEEKEHLDMYFQIMSSPGSDV